MTQRFLLFLIVIVVAINGSVFWFKHKTSIQGNQLPLSSTIMQSPFDVIPNKPEVNPLNNAQEKHLLVKFVHVDTYRESEKDSVYGDIISHSRSTPFGDSSGRSTNAHETTHGINAEIRNATNNRRMNGFYVLNGRGVLIEEPNITMSDVVKLIPSNLRSYRYDLYMVQQLKDWNDTPLYICDEWIAYINGGKCCIDDVKKGKHNEKWSDGVSGCLDFSIYTAILAMAVKQHDPTYWNSNEQFRNFIHWQLLEAEKTFLEGRVMSQFKWDKQDELLRELLTSPLSESVRTFLRQEFAGVWLDIDPVSLSQKTN